MRNLFILQKYKLMEIINKFRGKKEHQKSFIAGVVTFCLLIVLNLAIYINIAISMFNGLGNLGLDKMCLFHAIITTFSVLLIIGIMRVSSNSKTNDTDLLLSLPIKKYEIILLKTFNFYLFDLAFSILLFSPFLILYVMRNFMVSTLILGLIFMFLLPLFSVAISHIFSFVISKLFNRFKAGNFFKALTSVFLYIIILVLLFIKTTSYGFIKPEGIDSFFEDRPYMNILLNFILSPNITNISITLCSFIIPFIIGTILFSLFFGKPTNKYKNKNQNLKFSNNSFGYILYKKELSFYVSSPTYVINTIIGPIMIIIFSIMFCIYKNNLSTLFGLSLDTLFYIFMLLICIFLSSTLISCSSMSLEGKNLWIIKTLPVDENKLFTAKALTQFTISQPAILISAIILIASSSISVVNLFLFLGFTTIFNLLICFSGVLINLIFPKYDFDNEVQVIKQSMSVVLTMLFGIFMALIPLLIYFIFKISLLSIALISFGVYVLILGICLFVLYSYGKKIFNIKS